MPSRYENPSDKRVAVSIKVRQIPQSGLNLKSVDLKSAMKFALILCLGLGLISASAAQECEAAAPCDEGDNAALCAADPNCSCAGTEPDIPTTQRPQVGSGINRILDKFKSL